MSRILCILSRNSYRLLFDIQNSCNYIRWVQECRKVQRVFQAVQFEEQAFFDGHTPNQSWPGHVWGWLKKRCFPDGDLEVASVNVFNESTRCRWKGAEFHGWCTTFSCFRSPHLYSEFGHRCTRLLPVCCTNELSSLCLNLCYVSIYVTNFRERIFSILGYLENASLSYSMVWSYSISTRQSMNGQNVMCYVTVYLSSCADIYLVLAKTLSLG